MNAQTDLDALREYLATRDAACPSCGYNLRGLTSDRCPECHQEIALRVSLVDPRVGLFLVGVVGWALGAGFSVLLLMYGGIAIFRYGNLSPGDLFFVILLTGGVAQGSVLLSLLICNRRVRRWSTQWRVLVAVSGFAASLANVLIFALNVR
jgi:hypothetical protein